MTGFELPLYFRFSGVQLGARLVFELFDLACLFFRLPLSFGRLVIEALFFHLHARGVTSARAGQGRWPPARLRAMPCRPR